MSGHSCPCQTAERMNSGFRVSFPPISLVPWQFERDSLTARKIFGSLTGPCHVPTQWGSTSQPADISDDGGKEKMDWHVSWEQAKEIRDTGPVVMYLLDSSKAGLHDVCHAQG